MTSKRTINDKKGKNKHSNIRNLNILNSFKRTQIVLTVITPLKILYRRTEEHKERQLLHIYYLTF